MEQVLSCTQLSLSSIALLPFIIVLYGFFFAMSMVFLKILYDDDFDVGQANFISSSFQTLFSYACFRSARNGGLLDFTNDSIYYLLGFFVTATVFRQVAVDYSDAGNCASFLALVPLVTAPIALYYNSQDPFDRNKHIISSVICVVAVVLIVQPPFLFSSEQVESTDIYGYIIMLFSIVTYSLFLVFQRASPADEYFITFWSSVSFMAIYFCIMIIEGDWIRLSASNLGVIVSHGVCRVCAGIALSLGSSKTSPALTGILIMLEIPFTYVLQWILLGIELNALTYIGVFLLLISSVWYKLSSGGQDHHGYEEIRDLSSKGEFILISGIEQTDPLISSSERWESFI